MGSSDKIEVFVSILPQQYLVQQIGAERVNVNVMVKPGQSPETFEPSSKLMSRYSIADIFFTIGMPFEQVWIKRVASLNQHISVVNTQRADKELKENLMLSRRQHQHHYDPHTWLSPVLFLAQAKVVVAELIRMAPQDEQYFFAHYQQLETKIKNLDKELKQLFEQGKKYHFITFHPAFSYFAQQYGLRQEAIEVDGKAPSARQITHIIKRIKNKQVKFILIEKQFNQNIAQTIAQSVNAQLLVIDPLAWDYIDNMKDVANKINKALF